MSIIVQKYGGSSVGSTERIRAVAKRVIETKMKYPNVVVVVSAMGDTTDDLVKMTKEVSDNPSAREYDALISTGENISAALLAMAIQAQGIGAISLSGAQAGIHTENLYSKAKITKVDPSRIMQELDEGKVVIVTGFQGINDVSDITTIGRGGSDTSAVVLAAALGSPVCEIYTDVDGVYTTDPRVVPEARRLAEISYDEMLELASLGAKVLHPRSVECAKENNIALHVRSSFVSHEGTYVKEDSLMEMNKPVTGATLSDEEVMISILKVQDNPGIASKIFTKLAEASVNVDMIVQSTQEDNINNITFTVHQDDLKTATLVGQEISREITSKGITFDDNVAKVSIVGVGMISKPGIAARMFRVLGDEGINIKLISTSEIKISCVVDRKDARRALKALHQEFELQKA